MKLEQSLNKALGFSPSLLGIAMARKWNLAPELRHALGDKVDLEALGKDKAEELSRIGKSLEKICEVGEALARANDPEQYPTARSDWNLARKEIEARLGLNGLKLIHEKAIEKCRHYADCAPQLFKKTAASRLERHLSALSGDSLFAANHYIDECPPLMRQQLKELYAKIEPEAISKENLKTLTSTIIPSAGFILGIAFGNIQRAGVLYLESTPELVGDKAAKPVVRAQALNKTLMDCLKLH